MPARRRRHNSSPEITDGFTDSTPDFIDNDSDDTSSSDSDGSGTNSSSSYTLIDPDTDHMVVIPNDLHDSGNGDLSDSFLSEPRTRIVQFVERLFGGVLDEDRIDIPEQEPGPSNLMPTLRSSRGRSRRRARSSEETAEEQQPGSSNDSEIPTKKMKIEQENALNPFVDASFQQTTENGECIICYEEYVATGAHRVSCLKCGHLFGKSCIERWVRQEKNCPACKSSAKVSDIRDVFINFSAFNERGSESKQLQQQIKDQNDEIDRLKIELAKRIEENEDLRAIYVVPDPDSTFKIRLKKGPVQPITVKTYARPFDVSLDGEFYITVCDMMAIGANAKPHGIIKYPLNGSSQPLKFSSHSKQIRCISICPFRDRLVASVAEDGILVIRDTKLGNSTEPRFSLKLADIPSAVCWESDAKLIVGLRNGCVERITIGNRTPDVLIDGGEKTGPVNAVAYDSNHRVIFVATSKCVYAYRDSKNGKIKLINEPLQSFYYDEKMECFLVTTLPSKIENIGAQLLLYKVEFGAKITATQIRRYATNSTKTTQATTNIFWTATTGHIICAFYDESKNRTRLFNWGKIDSTDSDSNEARNEFSLPQEEGDLVSQYAFLSRSSQPSEVAPNGNQSCFMILSRKKLCTYFVLYE